MIEPSVVSNEIGKLAMGLPAESAAAIAICQGPVAAPPFCGVAITTKEATTTTVRLIGAAAPPPGVGFETVTVNVCAVVSWFAGITADNCVGETKLVAMGVLPKLATVACVNAVPVTVIVVSGAPAAITVGEIFERVGMGYASETAADADLLGSAWLVAVTVTLAGLGAGSGGV